MIESDELKRVIGGKVAGVQEEVVERALRPRGLAEYVGQEKIREQLAIFIAAAKKRGEALDHVLLFGPPGLGKTTLSHILAYELGVNLRQTSGPVLERPGDLAALLTNLEPRDVLFIDEIHRLSPIVEEILYPALEDFQLDIMIGEGPAARSVKLDLPPFTLVGATTRAGMLTNPLRDRFGIVARLEFYNTEELLRIVKRSAALLNIVIDDDGARELARRSRGTPRIANRLLRRVRDYAEVKAQGDVTRAVADAALSMLDVDGSGLDVMDRKLLQTVLSKFAGGPVGVDNLAAAIGEERDTIEDVLEPYLIQQGFLQRTSRGRVATALSFRHFGLTPPSPASRSLQRRRMTDEQPFRFPVRVYYEDTDAAGVVYYANYLKFMERARTEWLASLGLPLPAFGREHGVVFVVHRCEIDFNLPARLNDHLVATVEGVHRGASRLVVRQEVRREDAVLTTARVTLACLDAARWRPVRMPGPLVQRLDTL